MAKQKKTKKAKVDLRRLPRDERPKPSTGQSAPARQIAWDAFNAHERAVVKLLDGGGGRRVPRRVEYLADGIDADNPRLAARNALRRPVSSGWVDRVDSATYVISELGRQRYNRATA
jgi:hypothetical protein